MLSLPEMPGIPGCLNVAEEVKGIGSQVGTQGSVETLENPSKAKVLEQFRSSTIVHFA